VRHAAGRGPSVGGVGVVIRRVAVLGGGVAGIAASVALADAGARVTLLEMTPRLGGRATSRPDPKSGGADLDNCQHVVMRCCTAILGLYDTLGVGGQIDWHDRFHFVHADGTGDTLKRGWLPAPLHLAGSFLRWRGLGWRDKVSIARTLGRMRRLSAVERGRMNDQTFGAWLSTLARAPSPGALERFWEPTVVSACNLACGSVAAGYAVQVFVDGMMAGRRGYEMGLSRVPLARLYDPAVARIARAGGAVRFGARVKTLDLDAKTMRVRAAVLADGTRVAADACVSALPADALARVLPEAAASDPRLTRLNELQPSPIVGLHLWLADGAGRPLAMPVPHLALTGSRLHWLFDRGVDAEPLGRHLHAVISGAAAEADRPAAELLDLALAEVRRVVPGAGDAVLIDGRVVVERRATFAALPGVDALRPAAACGPNGGVVNLLLAGDWTDTGWPATMEGAARSGRAAAEAAWARGGFTTGPAG